MLFWWGAWAGAGRGDVTFSVSFDDPAGAFAPHYDLLASNIAGAGAEWAKHLNGNVDLHVVLRPDDSLPRAGGRSVGISFVRAAADSEIWEPGAAAELRTGLDGNAEEPDIELFFNPDYLFGELWLDPAPDVRLAPVPPDRTDAVSIFMHEIGHALGFNGWRDWTSGLLGGSTASPFDELVTIDNQFYFTGSQAMALHLGAVPLTNGNLYHVGNAAPGPGDELVGDLMNGVVATRGVRYDVSPLDVAILQDLGLPIFWREASADFDSDGDVDGRDLMDLVLGFGAMGGMVTRGDADFDADVDRRDLEIWRQQVGAGEVLAMPPPGGGTVPEPAGWLLLLLAVVCQQVGGRVATKRGTTACRTAVGVACATGLERRTSIDGEPRRDTTRHLL
jgi:hypothetical protein